MLTNVSSCLQDLKHCTASLTRGVVKFAQAERPSMYHESHTLLQFLQLAIIPGWANVCKHLYSAVILLVHVMM